MPRDVRIVRASDAHPDFHARFELPGYVVISTTFDTARLRHLISIDTPGVYGSVPI
ncbi:hypothetical protein MASR2M48_22790 [Spirochaetota bacterium]